MNQHESTFCRHLATGGQVVSWESWELGFRAQPAAANRRHHRLAASGSATSQIEYWDAPPDCLVPAGLGVQGMTLVSLRPRTCQLPGASWHQLSGAGWPGRSGDDPGLPELPHLPHKHDIAVHALPREPGAPQRVDVAEPVAGKGQDEVCMVCGGVGGRFSMKSGMVARVRGPKGGHRGLKGGAWVPPGRLQLLQACGGKRATHMPLRKVAPGPPAPHGTTHNRHSTSTSECS